MDLRRNIHSLLREIGPGQQITRSAYDTAWVARLAEVGEPIGEQALEWLRSHQLVDGSWGTTHIRYHHERLVCTLAAMIALARQQNRRDIIRLQRARLALELAAKGLEADPAGETVGFEMIVPTLVTEARALGLLDGWSDTTLERLVHYRQAKLAALRGHRINRQVTIAFSAEMVGPDGLHLLDVENLQEENGTVSYSPAATAFFALYVRRQDPRALGFLDRFAIDGAVPYVVPIDVFERAWPLWNLALAGQLDQETLALCEPHLDFLESAWIPGKGIASIKGLALTDGDDTGITFDVLTRFGREGHLDGVLYYEENEHFRCYGLEANPSISANVHILGALRQAGLGVESPPVHKILRFLQQTQTLRLFWFDKWHISPYYPTAHAVIACAGFADELVEDAVYWLLETQNPDGSWGYYLPTAEETAYCLQALVLWKRHNHSVSRDVLKRGAAWLADHMEPPYLPLWIGKCLYCPELVVRSAILGALLAVEQE